jgi:hypothetical protein
MLAKVSPIALLALLLGCAPVEQPTTALPPADATDAAPGSGRVLDTITIAEGNTSPAGPGEFVYRDAAEWRALESSVRDPAYRPSMSNEGVLLAAVNAPTGGFQVRFDSVYVLPAGDVAAVYTVHAPGPNCMVTQALTEPFHLVAVPGLPPDPVRFTQRNATYDC